MSSKLSTNLHLLNFFLLGGVGEKIENRAFQAFAKHFTTKTPDDFEAIEGA